MDGVLDAVVMSLLTSVTSERLRSVRTLRYVDYLRVSSLESATQRGVSYTQSARVGQMMLTGSVSSVECVC